MNRFLHNDPLLQQRRRELRRGQTAAEKAIWQRIRNRQFQGKRFIRQYSIGPYILDFYCPEIRLGIELDGGQHAEDERRGYDAARSEYLKVAGVYVMRFWNNEVMRNMESVLRIIGEKVNDLS